MSYHTNTDIGKVRSINEDSYRNYTSDEFSLHIIADGMGGHQSGEIASYMAVKYIGDYIIEKFNRDEIFDTISESIMFAHKKILNYSKNNPESFGMGTTVIISLIYNNILYFANIGDSRIYLFSDNKLNQITKDHSYVQELLDAGAITKEEASFYPRNQITSALGTDQNYKLDLDRMEVKKDDIILMTTDGLTDLIDDNDILDVLIMRYSEKDTTEILTYMANSTGGKDNITITCIKID